MSDRLTAIDIEQHAFPRKMRGFDADEVRMYLKTVGGEFERLTLENGEQREVLGRLERDLDEYRSREKTLQDALLTATRMSEDITEKARREADLLVKEARMRAERILQQAQDQLARIEDEIGRARLERDAFERRLRDAVEQHLELLELRQADRKDGENLRVLRSVNGPEAG